MEQFIDFLKLEIMYVLIRAHRGCFWGWFFLDFLKEKSQAKGDLNPRNDAEVFFCTWGFVRDDILNSVWSKNIRKKSVLFQVVIKHSIKIHIKMLCLHEQFSFAYLLCQENPVLSTFWTDYVTCWFIMTNWKTKRNTNRSRVSKSITGFVWCMWDKWGWFSESNQHSAIWKPESL